MCWEKLLHDANVPLLILNACRSADNEPPEKPLDADLYQQIRQFGSFAHAVMDYGATGVVAWRYSVFVVTAAQYMLELYGALASGLPLGEAATLARKQLNAGKRSIEDWTVPIVFEAVAARLFPMSEAALDIKITPPATADSGLPQAPDIGFIGRDETVLKLDRTFDDQNIVLLHALAGSGKTSTAGEFVRWYKQTEGLTGPVLFTSFEQHKTLPRVLDELGRVFEGALSKNGIHWLTLADPQRRDVALQLLRLVPVFWIWDNVEPIAGFPAGTPSAWNAEEQKELVDFLRAAHDTKAKFLLTSRRDEGDWLHDVPARIELPPMPFDERVQMTEALAKKFGRRLDDVDDWRPLLRFTQGNPLTLTVLVGQALRDGLKTHDQIAKFVRKLQSGEAVFEDEASEGRTRSLAASLEYGFDNAFTETEGKQLALLHLFQGFVDVDALRLMADISREAGIALLDRAAEIGLLTALGGGYYTIHPALPWFFRRLFEQYYSETHFDVTRAFVQAVAALGNYYWNQYEDGNRGVIRALTAEEPNLLNARTLARTHHWWGQLIGTMQGLRMLYHQTGRRVEWFRLVEEIVPDFIDPVTEGVLTGKEEYWSLVTGYRVGLAREGRHWEEAERLQSLSVNWNRKRAAPVLSKPPHAWDATEKNAVSSLGAVLHELSEIQLDKGSANCLEGYLEALSLAELIGDRQKAAICGFNLGRAYARVDGIRDLANSEHWLVRSLGLLAKEDRMARAQCLGELGMIAYLRFDNAREVRQPSKECLDHLAKAQHYYVQALQMFPANAVRNLQATHNQLGIVYANAGQIDTALRHYGESIRYQEAMQDRFAAGQTRHNAALALFRAGRFSNARDWAQSALRDYEFSESAEQEVVMTLKLLEAIESALQAISPPSSAHPPQPH
jgi:tetratricopeptide (TPR) repeat protein